MGSLGGLLGTAGGANGSGFSGPSSAVITPGTSPSQLAGAQNTVNNSLASQQALLQALQGTYGVGNQANALQSQAQFASQQAANNGLGNQASAYTQAQQLANQQAQAGGVSVQQQALQQQQALNAQLAGVNGTQNQQSALASQQALAAQQQATAAQYQGIANGTGPNPAQAMLNQQTGTNVANQAALMAGQRGASSNVGLIARQAAQQGAATQQQAVNQGATLQAQQSLNALSGLSAQQQAIGGTQQSVANIAAQQVGQQQAGIGAAQGAASNITAQQQAQQQALAQQAQTQVAQQQQQQQAVAGLATQQVNQQQTQQQANTQAALQAQQIQQQALAAQNNAQVSMQSNINQVSGGLAQTNMQGQQGIVGGIGNAVGGVLGSILAKGGEVIKPKHFDQGGWTGGTYESLPDSTMDDSSYTPTPTIPPPGVPAPNVNSTSQPGPQSKMGQFLQNKSQGPFNLAGNNSGAQALQQGIGSIGSPLGAAIKKWTTPKPINVVSQEYDNTPQETSGDQNAPTSNPGYQTDPETGEITQIGLAAKGGITKRDFTAGGPVDAQNKKEKATKSGNSYANDKIPALLSEHEIVIPRSITQGPNPIRGSADFVAKVLAKRKVK